MGGESDLEMGLRMGIFIVGLCYLLCIRCDSHWD